MNSEEYLQEQVNQMDDLMGMDVSDLVYELRNSDLAGIMDSILDKVVDDRMEYILSQDAILDAQEAAIESLERSVQSLFDECVCQKRVCECGTYEADPGVY
jgi:hypothetical protein